jgi:RNA polymerase sigma-70 factor (ECF subfamily)
MDILTKQRILHGDFDAYGDVVREYQDMLLGYALRRVRVWSLAEEVVQLTFIRAYHQLADFRADEDFGVWLCVTCKYLILTELEKQRREAKNLANYREQLRVEIDSAVTEDMEPDFRRDQMAVLRDCVGKLGREAAELVALRYFNERSCKEIAEQKQRTVSWVTTTLNRVRKTLRDCMERSLQSGVAS